MQKESLLKRFDILRRQLNSDEHASTAKIALWYTFSNIFMKGIAFISTPIFTRLLSKEAYGNFSNFTSWEGILEIIVTLDFTVSIARAKYDYEDNMNEYLSSILLFSNLVTVLAYLIILINAHFFTHILSMSMKYITVMFVYMLFMPAFSYLQVKFRIYRKYKFFVLFSVTSALLRTVISVVLVWFLEDKLWGRVLGFVVPITVLNLALWIYIVYRGRKLSLDCVKYACAISIPLIPHTLSGILLGNSDRIMITNYIGSEATAVYSLAYQVSLLANLIWTSMNQAWAPWLYDNIHINNKNNIRNKSKVYLGVFAILIVGVLLVTPEMILLMGGASYYEARFVMPPVILGCCFQFVYGMYVNIEIYKKKTFIISIGTVSAAVLNLILNALFIPRFGYIAAAYTTLIGYAALLMFHFLIVHYYCKDLSDIYSKKFVFSLLGILMIICGATLFVYNYQVIRYIVAFMYFALIGIAFVRNKDRIISLIVKKR